MRVVPPNSDVSVKKAFMVSWVTENCYIHARFFFYSFGGFCSNQNIKSINKIIIIILKPFYWWSQNAERIVKLYDFFFFEFCFSEIHTVDVIVFFFGCLENSQGTDRRTSVALASWSLFSLFQIQINVWHFSRPNLGKISVKFQ